MIFRNKSFYFLALIFIAYAHAACKKIISIDAPINQLTNDKVFNSDESVIAATINLYTGLNSIDVNLVPLIGCYADDLIYQNVNTPQLQFYNNAVSGTNSANSTMWRALYSTIYQANSLIAGLQAANGITDSLKSVLLGEAKFVRAYCYFNLVNLWGEVPLIASTEVKVTGFAARSSTNLIYAQIVSDLDESKQSLPVTYASSEKVRPTRWAAGSLLARVYLHMGEWSKASVEASGVISSGLFTPLQTVNNTFLKNSKEAIWQLWNANGFSNLGATFIPSSGKPSYAIANSLLNSFDTGDLRKSNWIKPTTVSGVTYYYPYKYKQRALATGSNAEYTMYMRISEQYLIRAEANAQLGDIPNAIADVNTMRSRSGLTGIVPPVGKDSCLALIQKEKRLELFTEAGHRFFDLKRSANINSILSAVKPNWKATDVLLPVPQVELNTNPNLVQNPGY